MMFSGAAKTGYTSNDAKSFAPYSCSANNTDNTKKVNFAFFTGIALAVSVFFFAVLSIIIISSGILLITIPVIILIIIARGIEKQNAILCEG